MLALKAGETANPGEEALLTSFDPASIQTELDLWEHLSFSFDMDKDHQPPSNNQAGSSASVNAAAPKSRRRKSESAAPQSSMAPPPAPNPVAALPGQSNPPLPPGNPAEGYEALARALRALQEAYLYLPPQAGFPPQPPNNMPNNLNPFSQQQQVPPNLYAQFPWPSPMPSPSRSQPTQGTQQFIPPLPPFAFPTGGQFSSVLPPLPQHQPHIDPQLQPAASTSAAASTVSPQAANQMPSPVDSELNLTDEKRRRNTAASARFRIKKKQKTVNLERTVSDLSGRVEELEQEASDLRKENGWLKEIVMLKSKRSTGDYLQPDASIGDDDDEDVSNDKGEGSSTTKKNRDA
ncbi:hypothetical protein EW146_g8864 [Bondarzewia mesenterica]|uniref:BZIP domain-containing protein n=1 Tax=Bondarzewia mesenterica TaxID=1095465 RepID=A0A4V3XD93_9AGAM|nr:hypothetical protein EW146_g8864 [Bondarzewia mesenterica]